MTITGGRGGWCCFQSTDWPDGVFVRFADQAGRLGIVDVFFSPPAGRLSDRPPLARIEREVNDDERLANAVRVSATEKYRLDLRAVVSHFDTGPGSGDPDDPPDTPGRSTEWDTPLGQLLAGKLERKQRPAWKPVELDWTPPAVPEVPATRPYPDEFIRQIADMYRAYVQIGHKPTGEIASQTGVVQHVAEHWVRLARKRGFLPPAQHGKAG